MKKTDIGVAVLLTVSSLLFGAASGPSEAQAGTATAADGPSPPAATVLVEPEAFRPSGQATTNADIPASVAAATGVAAGAPRVVEVSGACPGGMVEIEGDYCPNVEQKCLKWIDPEDYPARRCAEYEQNSTCTGKTAHKHFCMDRYEYPNRVGEKPVVMRTWYQAKATCEAAGKRLCGESEWTLACEGQEHLPYPYGYARSSEACNIDKPHPDVNEAAIADPKTRQAEVDRLWQGEPSGTRDQCVSPFGVHDMTGNVDEWVVNESGHPYKSGLKGGYWGPVRDRCRPMTIAHNEDFLFYQIGFRCCSQVPDSPGSAAAHPAAADKVPTPPAAPSSNDPAPATNPAPDAPLAGS
jgi:hypothetical protein